MTPGLAFFEAGLLRSRNSISILMQCWSGLCILSTLWYIVGFSLCFGEDLGSFIGNPWDYFVMKDVAIASVSTTSGNVTTEIDHHPTWNAGGVPTTVFASFQMMFAVITPLLITGAFSERVDFTSFVWFIILWSVVVYYPVCHWVWGGGWMATIGGDNGGAVDFAGGIVIHTTAGVSSAVVAIILGPRTGFNPDNTSWMTESRPHSIPLAMIGAALLWMGWFGFNAGSAVASGHAAGHTLLCTHIAASIGGIVWMILSMVDDGKPSIVATLNGSIAGLAGVTPASGFIHSQSAAVLGIVLGVASYYGVKMLKGRFKIDDALDVSSVHGITGIVGSLAIGLVAHEDVSGSANIHGLFFGGGGALLGYQAIAIVVSGAWAGAFTFIICKVLESTCGFRVSKEMEETGLDLGLHGETARVLDMSPNAMSPKHAAQTLGNAFKMPDMDLGVSVATDHTDTKNNP